MTDGYIVPDKAWKKIKLASKIKQTCYIFGATQFGKTRLVKQFMGNKKYSYLSCREWGWDKKLTDYIKGDVFVLDDMYLLGDEEKRQQVLELAENNGIWFVMINRSPVPSWLIDSYINKNYLVISENELLLSPRDIEKYFADSEIDATDEEIGFVTTASEGNQFIVRYAANQIKLGTKIGPELYNSTVEHFVMILREKIIPEWDNDVSEFLMKMSVVDEFNIPMAEMITCFRDVPKMLQRVSETGNFIIAKGDTYKVRPILNKALRQQAQMVYSKEEQTTYLNRAALYYETNNMLVSALEIYKKQGDTGRIKDALILNARENPGSAKYYELRDYYFALSNEDILSHPSLIGGMSMLNSLLLNTDESIYWYDKLVEYIDSSKGGAKREAKASKFFLDIALTHFDSTNFYELIKSLPSVLIEYGTNYPNISATSNCPTTMNGGKDFCEWSKRDKFLASAFGGPVEKILGNSGKGLTNVSLAESSFEKGEDFFDILSLITRGRMEAEGADNVDILFVASGIEARMNLDRCNIENAINIIDSFSKKAHEKRAENLYDNIAAFQCRLALYNSDHNHVNDWLKKSPDENDHFYIFNRYSYLTKIRCYILNNELDKALFLIEKMKYYAKVCKRKYVDMECDMLTAIVRYRMGVEWQSYMMSCLINAHEYRFIRLISEEGAAVCPLLSEMKKDLMQNDELDDEWLQLLFSETEKMRNYYPSYLTSGYASVTEFSENGLKVLKLQAHGYSQSEICERLGLSEANVKYHIRMNYKKLGASNKGEAILMARNLHLI